MSKKKIKKLVVREFKFTKKHTFTFKKGERFSWFYDPETEQYYRPLKKLNITGKDLSDRFIKVGTEEIPGIKEL